MMAGGIQPGTTAWTAASREVDANVRDSAKGVFAELSKTHPELTVEPNIDGEWVFAHLRRAWAFDQLMDIREYVQDAEVKGSSPDGMVFFFKQVPVAIFEAKKQGENGNAIERWYKNYFVFSHLAYPFMPLYVTFLTGEGAEPGKVMCTTLAPALVTQGRTFNHLYPSGLSIFRSAQPFTKDFISSTIHRAVLLGVELSKAHIPPWTKKREG